MEAGVQDAHNHAARRPGEEYAGSFGTNLDVRQDSWPRMHPALQIQHVRSTSSVPPDGAGWLIALSAFLTRVKNVAQLQKWNSK